MYRTFTGSILSSSLNIHYVEVLQFFIYLKHIKHEAVPFCTYIRYVLLRLIRVLIYNNAYNSETVPSYVTNPLILCYYIKDYF